jgi:hypothetical protein
MAVGFKGNRTVAARLPCSKACTQGETLDGKAGQRGRLTGGLGAVDEVRRGSAGQQPVKGGAGARPDRAVAPPCIVQSGSSSAAFSPRWSSSPAASVVLVMGKGWVTTRGDRGFFMDRNRGRERLVLTATLPDTLQWPRAELALLIKREREQRWSALMDSGREGNALGAEWGSEGAGALLLQLHGAPMGAVGGGSGQSSLEGRHQRGVVGWRRGADVSKGGALGLAWWLGFEPRLDGLFSGWCQHTGKEGGIGPGRWAGLGVREIERKERWGWFEKIQTKHHPRFENLEDIWRGLIQDGRERYVSEMSRLRRWKKSSSRIKGTQDGIHMNKNYSHREIWQIRRVGVSAKFEKDQRWENERF